MKNFMNCDVSSGKFWDFEWIFSILLSLAREGKISEESYINLCNDLFDDRRYDIKRAEDIK